MITSIVVFNSKSVTQETVFHINDIKDAFCFENGAESYLLISTNTNVLHCFDIN